MGCKGSGDGVIRRALVRQADRTCNICCNSTHFGSSHFLGFLGRGEPLNKMATPSMDRMNEGNESRAPQEEDEDAHQAEKNSLEPESDASKDPDDHSDLRPSKTPEADPREFSTARRRKPIARQTTFIPALFYISPLDTSHALVIVGYIAVLVLSFGTRLYKLDEPDHVW